MATKGNIRSMRFSDEVLQLIESQSGDSFTAKFEALVFKCALELPQKQRELDSINAAIREKRELLGRMSQKAEGFRRSLSDMEYSLRTLERTIARAQEIEP